MAEKFLTANEVRERVALSKTEIYRRIPQETFPKPIPLGKWKVVWLESEIDAWMQAQADARNAGPDRLDRSKKATDARWGTK